mgnify:CR=1 FL=1
MFSDIFFELFRVLNNITFNFNHYNFIPVNQINASYPINEYQINGYQIIAEKGYDYIAFEIDFYKGSYSFLIYLI